MSLSLGHTKGFSLLYTVEAQFSIPGTRFGRTAAGKVDMLKVHVPYLLPKIKKCVRLRLRYYIHNYEDTQVRT